MADESKDDDSAASSASSPLKRGRRPPKPAGDKGKPKPHPKKKPKFAPKGGRKAPPKKPPPDESAATPPPVPPKKPELRVRVEGADVRPSDYSGHADSFRPGSAGTDYSRPSSGGSDYSERSMTPEEDNQENDAGGFFSSQASTASGTLEEELAFEDRPRSPTYYDEDDYYDDRPESPYSDDGYEEDQDFRFARNFGFRPMTPVAEGSEGGWSSPGSSRPNTSPYKDRMGSPGSRSGSPDERSYLSNSTLEEPFFHHDSVQTTLPEEPSLAEELGAEGVAVVHDSTSFPGASPDSSVVTDFPGSPTTADSKASESWETYTHTTVAEKSLDSVSVLTVPVEEAKLDGAESDETASLEEVVQSDEPRVSERIEKEAAEKAREAEACFQAAASAFTYESEKRELVEVELCVLSARDLRGADLGVLSAKSDPYVIGHVIGKKEPFGKTSWKAQTINPTWGGTQDVLRVRFDLLDDAFEGLALGVWDYDVSGDDALGLVTYSRDELLAPRLLPYEKALSPHPDQDVNAHHSGHLTVRIHVSGVVALFIDHAKHLLAADGATGGASDPYAVAKWIGHNSRKLSQTRTISNELSPQWKHAFLVPIPLIRPVHGGAIQVSVWDDDFFGSDDFLGQVSLDGSFIVRQRTMAKVVLPLKPRKKGEGVQGTVQLRVFCPPGILELCQQNTARVSNKTLTCNEIPRCHVRLTVLRCESLRRADCFATCAGDPYAVVFRDGHKLGRTPAQESTTNPCWEEKNLFRLTDVPTRVVDRHDPDFFEPKSASWFRRRKRKPVKDDVESDGDGEFEDSAPPPVAGETDPTTQRALKAQAEKLKSEALSKGEPAVDVHLELFDDDAVSKDFLGFTRVSWRDLMTPGVKFLPLKERPGYKGGKSQRYAAQGTVVIRISHEVIVHARAFEASYLPQRDVFDVPDAYCLFKWGRDELGKTKTAHNQLDPLWYGPDKPCEFSVPLEPDDFCPDTLTVEVWEEDLITTDDFLGLVTVSRADAAFPSPGVPHYLTRRPGISEDPAPQGFAELHLRASFIPGVAEPRKAQRIQFMPLVEHGGRDSPEAEVTVHILRGGNMVRTDAFGGADPFVILRRNGKVIGQTRTKYNTVKPHWRDEHFLVQVPLSSKGLPAERVEVRLEVWDQDLFSKTLMGMVRLGADDLCTDSVIRRYALQPECPSAAFLRNPEKVHPALGWLEVRCVVAGCLQLCVNQADDIRAADPSGTSDPFVKVKWAAVGCRTVGQCAPEKRTLNPRWNFTLNLSVPLTQPDCLFQTVVVEVWDHDFVGPDFLGLVTIDPAELVAAAETGALVTRRLLDKDEAGRKKRQADGTLSFKVEQAIAICNLRRRLSKKSLEAKTSNKLDGCTVKFCVTKCTNLKQKKGWFTPRGELSFLLPDPYVSVRLQSKRLGRTSTRPDTLNPIWTNENQEGTFTLKNVPTYAKKTQGTSTSDYIVTLGVFDDDVGRDRPMGCGIMHWEELMREGEHALPIRGGVNTDREARELKFAKHKPRMESHVTRAVKGNSLKKKVVPQTLEEHIQMGGSCLYVRVWHVARVRLRVTAAHDVRPADWGLAGVVGGRADPYCRIKYQGRELFKTKVCSSTLDPCWNCCYELTVPTHATTEGGAADLLVEVYDHDLIGSDDFLGCAVIPHDHLLTPHPGDTYELGPQFNAKEHGPVASGFLDVQIEASYIPGSMEPVPWPRALPDPSRDPLEKERAAQEVERKIRKLNKEKARADLELWARRDIRQALDKKSGRKYWWERLSKSERTPGKPVPRWWRDPRPPPIHPPALFPVPDVPPRPSPTKRLYAALNELEPRDLGFVVRPTVLVEVCVLRAGNLRNADSTLLGGSSDPYATIRYGPPHALKTIGRTSVVNNNCDPVWGQQAFRFPIQVDATCADYQLVVELYDSDGTLGDVFGDGDDALGMAVFTVSEYLNATGCLQRELRPQPGEKSVTGFVEIRTQLLARCRLHLKGVNYGLDEEGEADDGVLGALTAGVLGTASSALALGTNALALAQDAAHLAEKTAAVTALAVQDNALALVQDPTQLAKLAQSGAHGIVTLGQGTALHMIKGAKALTKKKVKRKKVLVRPKWAGWDPRDLESTRDKGAFYVDVPITRRDGVLELHCEQVGSRRLLGTAKLTTDDLLYGVQKDAPLQKVVGKKGKWLRGASLTCKSEVPKALAELIACVRGARTVGLSNNTLPRLAAVEIDIIRAQNLKQCDTFSLSDPFVVGYHGGEKIGTTKIINDTLSPIWPRDASSTFRVEHLRTCAGRYSNHAGGFSPFADIDYGVCLEVRDDDGPGRPTEFMGHCVLSLQDLLMPGEREFELVEDNVMGPEAFVCKHGRRSEVPARKRRDCHTCFTEEVSRCGLVPGWGWGACLCVTCAPVWVAASITRAVCFTAKEAWHYSWACAYCVEDYCCTCCPCDLPRTQPVRGRLLVRIRHFAEVELRILEGYNLQGVDEAIMYGKASADPYCVVEYRGKRVLKTKYRAKTLDPKWYEALTLEIEIPKRGAVGSDGEAPRIAGAPELPWEHPARAHIRADESALKITVWDHDTFSGDDLMGQLIVRPEFLLRPQCGTSWPLMKAGDATSRAQGFIELDVRASRVPGSLDPAPRRQFGALGHYRELTDPVTGRAFWYDVWTRETFWVHPGHVLKRERETLRRNKKSQALTKKKKKSWFSAKKETEARTNEALLLHGLDRLNANSLEPQMVLGMVLVRAHNLRNADGRFGKSDPYATLRFGSEVIGRTRTVKDSLDPEWFEGIRGVLPLHDEATDVIVEVWDDDGGRDDLLGEARLTSAQLYANADKVCTLPLTAKPGQPRAQGTVTIHFEVKLKCVLEVNSLRASEAQEVYCAAVWEGREVGECGRTATVPMQDELALWGHRMAVAVPVRWPLDVLVLEVREHRSHEEDLVLGCVRVDASILLPISFKEGEKPPEAPVLRFPLSLDPGLSVPVRKRDINRTGLVQRGKNIGEPVQRRKNQRALKRPSWVQKEIDEKRRRASFSRSFEEQMELERYAEEDGEVDATDHLRGVAEELKDEESFASEVEDDHMDESLAVTLQSFESEPEEFLSASRHSLLPSRKGLWDSLFSRKPSSKDATKPFGFVAKLLKWTVAVDVPPHQEKKGVLRSLSRRSLDRRSLLLDPGHGDLLIVRCVAPPGTLQEHANFAHANLQLPSANTLPKCTVQVEISRADDLPQADLLGKSDPFVEIYCGGEKVGRTKTIWKTLNPKWTDEFFCLRNVPGIIKNVQDEMDSKLELRVMDDELVSTPDFLGYAQLEHTALMEKFPGQGWRVLDLIDDPAGVEKVDKGKEESVVQSKVHLRGQLTIRTKLIVTVRVTIVGVLGLKRNDDVEDAVPDPFVKIKYLDKEWGEPTPARKDQLRPVWYHGVEVDVPVPDDGNYGSPLEVLVFDKGEKKKKRFSFKSKQISEDELIGTATVDHEDLVYPHDCPGLRDVLDASGAPTGAKVTLYIETSHIPGRVQPRRRPDVQAEYACETDARTGKVYWYDVCTRERMWDDPRPAQDALAAEIAKFELEHTGDTSSSLPLPLLRAKRGFPEPPRRVSAAGGDASARIWWKPSRPNGPPVKGFSVQRQRKKDGLNTWEDKGNVYVDAAAQRRADSRAAKAAGRSLSKSELQAARMNVPPCALIVDELANDSWYRFRLYATNDVGLSTPSNWSNDCRVQRPLPEGWKQVEPPAPAGVSDKAWALQQGSKTYYYNVKTGQTTWERPDRDPFALPTEVFLQFTTDELTHLQDVFEDKDVDRSHAISMREFEAALPALGEVLSPTDLLWLFYQCDLDSAAELTYAAFARAIATLKRARVERAPFYRWLPEKFSDMREFMRRPRVPRAMKKLVAAKEEEMLERVGAWHKVPHPEIKGSTYWVNPETGDTSYQTPLAVRYFLPAALEEETKKWLDEDELQEFETQFDAMDLDGSGAIDIGELKLLIRALTGETYSDAKLRGIMYEVDFDRSGEIDFDEFVLAMLAVKKGKNTSFKRLQLEDVVEDENVHALQEDGKHVKLDAAKKSKKRYPHGYYCVCGCRALMEGEIQYIKSQKKIYSIFPQLSSKQLKAQAMGGGKAAQTAVQQRGAFQETKYTPANLVSEQPRMGGREAVPAWSMQQTDYRREAVDK